MFDILNDLDRYTQPNQATMEQAGAAVAGGVDAAVQGAQTAAFTPTIEIQQGSSPGIFRLLIDGKDSFGQINQTGLERTLQRMQQYGQISREQMDSYISSSREGNFDSRGVLSTSSSPPPATSSGGGAPAAASGGSGGAASGGSSGGTSSGATPRAGSAQPQPSGGGYAQDNGSTTLGGGGGGGAAAVDFNRALGLNPGPDRVGIQGGQGSDYYGRPGSVLSGLDRNSSANDVLLNTVRAQEANRDAAVDIFGRQREGFEGNALRQSIEGSAQSLIDNPFSLDDPTKSKIAGRQSELISAQAQRRQQQAAGQAANNGVSRSGVSATTQNSIGQSADRQIAQVNRDLDIEQATRRPQELAAAQRAATDVLQQQQSSRERSDAGAAGVLAGSDFSADFALAGQLAGSPSQGPLVATGPRQGPVAGISYAGDSRYNPFR